MRLLARKKEWNLSENVKFFLKCCAGWITATWLSLTFIGGTLTAQTISLPLDLTAARQLDSDLRGRCTLLRENAPLREGLVAMESSFGVRIWLDRRIDPERKTSLTAQGESIGMAIEKLATSANAKIGRIENLVYVGPPDEVPLIEAAYWRLFQAYYRGVKPQAAKSLVWEKLTVPSQLLEELQTRQRWQLIGLEQLPHDLWDAGKLSDCTEVAQLTCLLGGFGLQAVVVNQGGEGILRIEPLTRSADVTQTYTESVVRGTSLKDWESHWPKAQWNPRTRTLTGPVQAHIDFYFDTYASAPRTGPKTVNELNAIRLTLTTEAEAGRVLDAIRAQLQRDFEIDLSPYPLPDELSKRMIKIRVEQVTYEELLKEIGRQLGIQFRRNGKNFEWTR